MDIIPFAKWAGEPLPALAAMQTPTSRVWLHHGASGASSVATLRAYLRHHVSHNGWRTIGYSYAIAEGKVFACRGAGRQGAHTSGQNHVSHGIVVVGDYMAREPADRDLDALVELLQYGHRSRWWSRPEITGGHREAPGASTACPGNRLQARIDEVNRRAAGVVLKPVPAPAPEPESWLAMATEDELRTILREEIEQAFGGRSYSNDASRIRRSIRAIADAQGLETRHPVEPDYKVEA